MQDKLRLTLIVPGLLGPLTGMGREGFPELTAPGLERLLCRADRDTCDGDGLEEILLSLFGVPSVPGGDLPIAPISCLSDVGSCDSFWWMRADPVHLRADRSHLMLFDSSSFDIKHDEAQSLVAGFNRLYVRDGWHLEAPVPTRWYLRLPGPPQIQTVPLSRAVGYDVDPLLPRGADAVYWHRVLNEVQMMFHEHPVNRRRERYNHPAINSVWFWGGGELPASVTGEWNGVWSNEPCAAGLADMATIPHARIPVNAEAWLERAARGGHHLMVLGDVEAVARRGAGEEWVKQIAQLDHAWMLPLHQALLRGQLSELTLCPVNGHSYTAGKRQLWRVWRRCPGLWAQIAAGKK